MAKNLKRKINKTLKKEASKIKQENGNSNKKDLKMIGIFFIIFIALLGTILFYRYGYDPAGTARDGDKVEVSYIGSLENGTVFDTTIRSAAKEAGIYNPKRGYSDLKFRIGEGQMIQGFDEAVNGMKVGENKIVIVPPEKAYGPYQEDKTLMVPWSKEIPLYDKITRDILIRPNDLADIFNVSTLKINDTLPASSKFKWPIRIIDVDASEVTGRLLVNINDYYEEGSFNYTIVSFTENEMVVKRRTLFDQLPSKFGTLILTEEKDRIMTRYNVSVGERVFVNEKWYYVMGVVNNSIVLDQNHPLAGKNLIFNITLDKIE